VTLLLEVGKFTEPPSMAALHQTDIPRALVTIRYVRRWHADARREVSWAFSEYQSCRRTGR
jgi:hypothetical protein